MSHFRFFGTVFFGFLLGISQANAVQISLSGDNVDRYFRILEYYVLPFFVVSTIVLLFGYAISRIYNREQRRQRAEEEFGEPNGSPEEGTAAFLRELKSTPPIQDPEPESESVPRLRLHRATQSKQQAEQSQSPIAPYFDLPAGEESEQVNVDNGAPLLLNVPATTDPDLGRVKARGETPGHGLRPRRQRETAPSSDDDDAAWSKEIASTKAVPKETSATEVARPTPRGQADPAMVVPQEDLDRTIDADTSGRSPRDPVVPSPPANRSDQESESPPAIARSALWSDVELGKRTGPAAPRVQHLKAPSGAPTSELATAQVIATDIVNALDYITTILQQCLATLADHIKLKDGLQLDEVRGMRISAFDPSPDLSDQLGVLGPDVLNAVESGYARVGRFNQIIGRLEQMAEEQPLDEGWNELIQQRLSETIYAIGQVRKQLIAVLPADADGPVADSARDPAVDQERSTLGRGVPFGGRRR